MLCYLLTYYCLSQSKCLLLRPRPRRPKSPLQHDLPSPMLSHVNTRSIYISVYVSPLHQNGISFMKSILWPLRGHSGRKTDSSGFCAGPWGSVQEESTKGCQRDPGICHKGHGTWLIFRFLSTPPIHHPPY